MTKNLYKVPAAKWRKWNETARFVFNALYAHMLFDQKLFVHPKAPVVKPAHWKTLSWNAAWIAADAAGVERVE